MALRINQIVVAHMLYYFSCCWPTMAQVTIQTRTVCLDKDYTPTLNINCPSGTRMWVNRAYNGKSLRDPPRFCSFPETDAQTDCIKYETERTEEIIISCSKRSLCTKYLTSYYELSSCDSDELLYEGNPYLAVEYICYTNLDDNGEAYPYANIELDWERTVNNMVLLHSDNYQNQRWKSHAQGACRFSLPPDSYLLVHVMDFRAKYINSVGNCAAELTLHDGQNWETVCGKVSWSYRNFTLVPALYPGIVDIEFHTVGENSEAKMEMIVEGIANSGGHVDEMTMACGRNQETFTTTAPRTTTTPVPTTTSAAPTTTMSTSTAPATTTAATTTTTASTHTSTIATSPLVSSSTQTSSNPTTTVGQPSGGDVPHIPDETETVSVFTTATWFTTDGNGTDVTVTPPTISLMSKIILGAALGGAVLLAVVLVAIVCCCTRRSRERARRQRQTKHVAGSSVIMAFDGSNTVNVHRQTKQQNNSGINRQKNPYIMNNQRPRSPGSDEFYSEILEDGRSDAHSQIGWHADMSMNYGHALPNTSKHNHARNLDVDYDPAFDKPTESTLKMAQGTTRGFSY